MPLISGSITWGGALVAVRVGVSRNRKKLLEKLGMPVPDGISISAQLDTGSFATGFQPSVFRALGIEPFRKLKIRTPSTKPGAPHDCDQFDVSVTFYSGMDPIVIPSVHAIASDDFDDPNDEEGDGVQAILGRDIWNLCKLGYFGPEQTFDLALP